MKMFIGIVPSSDIYNTVANIQAQFGDNRLEPHITLIPPANVINESEWVKAIEDATSQFSPFSVHLPATGFFGKNVLFIKAVSGELMELQKALTKVLQPFEVVNAKTTDTDYHPHLTLGRRWCGFTPKDFMEMKILAENYLSKGNISFTVNTVRIYYKKDHQKRYECFKDLPL